jgi:hypothetical protein
MNYKLYLTKVNNSWKINHLKSEDKNGTLEYVGTEKTHYSFNRLSSIDEKYLDVNEEFYFNYIKLIDNWYTREYTIRPIEFWIHEYVRYGTAFKLTFSEYYNLILKLYSQLPNLDEDGTKIYIVYDTNYNITNVETKLHN